MTAPQTAFERAGLITNRGDETAFLQQVATDTDATYQVIAHSSGGHEVHRIDLGNPTGPTVLVIALQHGDEMMPREATLAYLRDMAYTPTPEQAAYLADNRVVFIPDANPSGLAVSRNGVPDTDPNRGHFLFERLEVIGIADTIRETQPRIILDLHEFITPQTDEPDHLRGPNTFQPSPHLVGVQDDLGEQLHADMVAAGITSGIFGHSSPGTMSSAAPTWHAIAMLSEVHQRLDRARRVEVVTAFLDSVFTWHTDNHAAVEVAVAASRAAAVANSGPMIVPTSTTNNAEKSIPAHAGWVLHDPLPERISDLPIEVSPGGIVHAGQVARPLAAILLDPESPYQIMQTSRYTPGDPDPTPPSGSVPRTQLIGMMVHTATGPRRVVAAQLRRDGRLWPIRIPGRP